MIDYYPLFRARSLISANRRGRTCGARSMTERARPSLAARGNGPAASADQIERERAASSRPSISPPRDGGGARGPAREAPDCATCDRRRGRTTLETRARLRRRRHRGVPGAAPLRAMTSSIDHRAPAQWSCRGPRTAILGRRRSVRPIWRAPRVRGRRRADHRHACRPRLCHAAISRPRAAPEQAEQSGGRQFRSRRDPPSRRSKECGAPGRPPRTRRQPTPARAPAASTAAANSTPPASARRPGFLTADPSGAARRSSSRSRERPIRRPARWPGRVIWSFENLPSNPGQPLDPALVGVVDVPDAGIALRMQVTRNHDGSLPAPISSASSSRRKDPECEGHLAGADENG